MTTAEKVSDLLRRKGLKLGCAESFTGGGIASKLIELAGASDILSFSAVCYSNEAKIKLLNVSSEIIERYGAVSEQTVEMMLKGLNKWGLSDVQVATSGNAGPTAEKADEVGIVYIGVMYKGAVSVERYHLSGDHRNEVIAEGVQKALEMVYTAINK